MHIVYFMATEVSHYWLLCLILNIPHMLANPFFHRSLCLSNIDCHLASVTQESIHHIPQCAFWIWNSTVRLVPSYIIDLPLLNRLTHPTNALIFSSTSIGKPSSFTMDQDVTLILISPVCQHRKFLEYFLQPV